MKTLNLLTLTVVTGSLLTLTAHAGIIGSPHDFSQRGWALSGVNPADPNTVCSVCHVPHHASSTYGPLWGHDPMSGGTWQMYANGVSPGANVKGGAAAVTQPNPSSLACLSCHDGSIAVNAYGSAAAPNRTAGSEIITNGAAISERSQNLTHSHPISFNYQALYGFGPGQDKWIWPYGTPVLTPSSGSFTPGNDMSIKGFLLDAQGNVECNSCHDVHNQEGSPYDIANNPHLVKINGTAPNSVNGLATGSLLCRSCHNK